MVVVVRRVVGRMCAWQVLVQRTVRRARRYVQDNAKTRKTTAITAEVAVMCAAVDGIVAEGGVFARRV